MNEETEMEIMDFQIDDPASIDADLAAMQRFIADHDVVGDKVAERMPDEHAEYLLTVPDFAVVEMIGFVAQVLATTQALRPVEAHTADIQELTASVISGATITVVGKDGVPREMRALDAPDRVREAVTSGLASVVSFVAALSAVMAEMGA